MEFADTGLGRQAVGVGHVAAFGKRGAEMQAAQILARAVTDRLHEVDFPGSGPGTIGLLHWQHPYGSPEALALGSTGADLETAIPLGEQRLAGRGEGTETCGGVLATVASLPQ
jgi:hypothetical protein